MDPSTITLTFEEFERLPDHPGKRELVKGEVIELPPAKYRHNRSATEIFKRLDAALEQAHARGEAAGLGEVCIEMGYYLRPDGWLVPDVSVTHAGQLVGENDYIEESPAIAIEVVSARNTAEQMDAEIDLYFEHGALEVWLIYPKTRRAHIYVGGQPRVVRESEAITTALLPGFSLLLGDVL